MPIEYAANEWLKQAGYRNHCFISWPHNVNSFIVRFARRLEEEIRDQLALQIQDPCVFLDESDMTPGAVWPHQLRLELCSSLSMVALCAPVYFNPVHRFCGLEWAAMEVLGHRRMTDDTLKTIIPIKVSELGRLPLVIAETQWIDVSHGRLRSRFLNTDEFRRSVSIIIKRIEQIAMSIYSNRVLPRCADFNFPSQSAFDGFDQERPQLPLSA